MSIPTSEPLPPEDRQSIPPARRRRQDRLAARHLPANQADLVKALSYQASPTIGFYLFMALAGLVFGLAGLLDAPALFILAALVAPFLAPVFGLALAARVGSGRFFLSALFGLLVGFGLVFAGGLLGGFLAKAFFPQALAGRSIYTHALLTIPDGVLLCLGIILTVTLLVRNPQQRPLAANAALTYSLVLPVGAAGFGLGSGLPALFPDGLIVFAIHLAGVVLLGVLILALLGLRPRGWFGYTLGSTLLLLAVAVLLLASGLLTAFTTQAALPPSATPTPSTTPGPTQEPTPSATAIAPTPSLTSTRTLIPSETPTLTVSPQPTPIWAMIEAGEGGGAWIRKEPNGELLITVLNGTLVQVLPDLVVDGNTNWVHVLVPYGETSVEGWILRSLLQTATPAPDW
jgi:hypothetical protein